MSKRKSRAKSMYLDKSDFVFEDDSDVDLIEKIEKSSQEMKMKNDQNKSHDANLRTSSRAKKTKAIYDPSENNAPVHKKKKEALEMAKLAQNAANAKKQLPVLPTKNAAVTAPPLQIKAVTKTPTKSPTKVKSSIQTAKATNAKSKSVDFKKKIVAVKSESDLATSSDVKTLPLSTAAAATTSISSSAPASDVKASKPPQPTAVAPSIKEPSKRIQARKKSSSSVNPALAAATTSRDRSASGSGNSEFEKASTVDLNEGKAVADVSKWTCDDVYNYFIKQKFEENDARKFKDQEIDGETLLILQRDDLKNLNLKVGIFVKMWNRILTFQSGSSDFTQGWK